MGERIQSLRAFWPYYLGEHRSPLSRRLHFVGTTGWMLACVAGAVSSPIFFPLAMAAFFLIGWDATRREHRGRPLIHMLLMLVLPALANPAAFLPGVVFAYGCAWVGHFVIEKNRPATFYYPVWSLASDLKMWSFMARGQLWSGDPLEALRLTGPAASAS